MSDSGLIPNLLNLLRQMSYAWADPRPRPGFLQFALGFLCSPKPKTQTSILRWLGRQDQDWTWAYRLSSQTHWESADLFAPILHWGLSLSRPAPEPLFSAQDDTLLRKRGRRIPGTAYGRDPLSPPFHVNLVLGQRFLQTTLLVPTGGEDRPWRSITISFRHAPALKAPPRASPEQKAAVKRARKHQNLCTAAAEELRRLRAQVDQTPGGAARTLIHCVDGGYAKKSYLSAVPARTTLVFRLRKDAHLQAYLPPAERRGRAKYGALLPTPEQVLQDDARPWQTVCVYAARQVRALSYKVLEGACWPTGAGDQPVRVLALNPAGYRLRKGSRLLYRQPAYLGVLGWAEPAVSDQPCIQGYVARWEIEVNHHDEKDGLGVGQAQVWNPQSVPRTPALEVGCYAALLLSSLMTFQDRRTEAFGKLPKWRKHPPQRPSLRDLIRLTRKEAGPYLEQLRDMAQERLAA